MINAKPLRTILFILCTLLGAFLPRMASAQNYCDPNYQFAAPGSLTTYHVVDASRIVVMEYMPWTGPNAYPLDATMDVPQLGSMYGADGVTYDMTDCRVLGQHARWMVDMGVDAILLDLSNVGQCIFANGLSDDTVGCHTTPINDLTRAMQVKQNVLAIYAYYHQHNVPIRIIPMLDAQDTSLETQYPNGETGFQRGLQFFEARVAQYPNHVLRYRNRPMMSLYVGTPYTHDGELNWMTRTHNAIAQLGKLQTFTYRFVTGFTDSQCPLWDTDASIPTIAGLHRLAVPGVARPVSNPVCNLPGAPPLPTLPYPVWSWIDRFSGASGPFVPTYSVETTGGRPENFTVTTAFSGTDCSGGQCLYVGPQCPNPAGCVDYWRASNARHRGTTTSTVLDDFMEKAKVLQPRFLLLHQFNEFGHGDQGWGPTRYRMTDVEPTSSVDGASGWGNDYINLYRDKVADYKAALTRPIDVSTRAYVGTGNDVLISGFTIAGPGPKKVLIRGAGPSLATYFPGAALMDPRLDLSTPAGWISNDDWGAAPNAAEIQQIAGTAHAKEAAILTTLNPGNYSVIMQGVGATTGIGLLDVYEVDNPGSPLSGASARGWVGVGNNQLIMGLVIGGTQPQKVLIRAAGPTLAPYGLNALSDPLLTLVGNGYYVTNDNWQTAGNWPEIAPADRPADWREPAILITLPPGAYSVIVSGVGGAQGIALPSVYLQ